MDTLVDTLIYLSQEEYKKSVKFALKLWYAGKPTGDWRNTGTKRDIGKYVTDQALGKLAEIAFAKFLEKNWRIKSEINFEVIPGALAVDHGDLVAIEIEGRRKTPGIKIDVKSTKPKSVWAVVDLREFNRRRCDAYVWVKVGLPLNHLARPIFEWIRNKNLAEIERAVPSLSELTAQIEGFAYREDVEKWAEFRRGETVFDPDKPSKKLFTAKTDNKAHPISKLRKSSGEWSELIRKMVSA